ncbi:MAG TPA: PDZ domain-containing protein [Labilithrix sp.]|nr:PDZ domain-containing protein [Labilithrix sp.]
MFPPFERAAPGVRVAVFALACLIAALLVLGCERPVGPPLVEVTDLTPRAVEPNDRLEIHGTGFPQGRTGRVTLAGTIFRAGQPPERGVSIDIEGAVVTPDRIEVLVRDALVERFCGRGDHAAHATFRGDVEVAFRGNDPNARPLVGVLRGAALDAIPASARASVLEDRAAEGRRVLSFLGIVPGAASPRGLPIERVAAGALAALAGIQVGDVVVEVDGVNVMSLSDVAPTSARSVELTIRHGDSGTEETKTLSLVDYSGERVPTEYAPALVIVGLALALLVIGLLPGPPWLALFEMRIASRVRGMTVRDIGAALFGRGRQAALSAMISATMATFALMPYVVGRELDGLLLLVVAATLLVGSRVVPERGSLASLRTLLFTGLCVIVMASALALAIGQLGAIELGEIVRTQGGAPWQFTAARHPACAVVSVVYGLAVIGILRTRTADAPSGFERAGALVASAVGVTFFLGGWQLPGSNGPRVAGWMLVGAALFVAKTWLVAAVLLGASRVTSSLRPRELPSLVVKKLLPGLLLAAALVVATRRVVPSLAIETAFGATMVAVFVLFLGRMVARVRSAVARPEPHASPFL